VIISKHKISTLCEVKTRLFYIYKETVYTLSIFSNIKFEHRLSLNYNLKKCLGAFERFSGPYKGPMKLIWANLIKDYRRMLQTKLRYYPSITSVEEDVLMFFFLFLALETPKRVQSNYNVIWANLIKDYPGMLLTKFGFFLFLALLTPKRGQLKWHEQI
jgi:hypothetical protein